MTRISFDKLYLIDPNGNQYWVVEIIIDKADIEFFEDRKDLPAPDKLPKDLKKTKDI